MKIFIGVVEDRKDPLKLGRCRVRVTGIHTSNSAELPSRDLPWATPIQPITSAAVSGIGTSPVGPVEGTWVTLFFLDGDDMQVPVMLGTIAGIPNLDTNLSEAEIGDIGDSSDEPVVVEPTYVTTGSGGVVTTEDDVVVKSDTVPSGDKVLGNMNRNQADALKDAIALSESSGGKVLDNKLGFLGRYQLGLEALEDQGYIKKGSSKAAVVELGKKMFNTKIYDPNVWTGKDGMKSAEDFKASRLIQEKTMDSLLVSNLKSLTGTSMPVDTPAEKQAGILATAHLVGKNAARTVIKTGMPKVDGNGTSTTKYYDLGYRAVAKVSTTEAVTPENIDKEAVDKTIPEKEKHTNNKKFDVPPKNANKQLRPTLGFIDPNGKYPKKTHVKESDVNRLARSAKLKQTIVALKEDTIETSIPIANTGVTWSQPPIPYAAKYPFNHVYESECGHTVEYDDTPDNERIHVYHKSGTFSEIDSHGNHVDKTVGHKIIIVEKDELVFIKGSGHVTILDDLSVNIAGQGQVSISGNANIVVGGSTYLTTNGEMNIVAGGNFNVSASAINFQSSGMFAVDSSQVHLNSGVSQSPKSAPSFSPEIEVITAPTREELVDMELEGVDRPSPTNQEPAPIKEVSVDKPADVVEVSASCDWPAVFETTQLSTNYKLSQLVVGDSTGKFPFKTGQHGLTDLQLACNLKHLAMNVIEPIREKYGSKGLIITSCFRVAGSKVSKSKRISQHELGCAVDIQFTSFNRKHQSYYDFAKELINFVSFDLFLLEYRDPLSVWFHISYKESGNRKQVLTLHNDKTVGQGLILL